MYNLGDLVAADAAFHHALSLPDLCIDHGYDHQRWQPGMLPPAVDADFLRWRIGQPNRGAWPEAIHEWADVVLRDADAAMYDAKTGGRSRWAVFDTRARERRVEPGLAADLARGVAREELVTWYQPVVDLRTWRVTGAEALVRWQHPQRGLVLPGAFIPAAEACGLIGQIGAQVLAAACRQAADWRFVRDRRAMHVNTAAVELSTHGFPETVAGVLLAAGLFFLAGAFLTWGASLTLGTRARRAERTIRQLEAQVQALRVQRSNPAGLLPPPGA